MHQQNKECSGNRFRHLLEKFRNGILSLFQMEGGKALNRGWGGYADTIPKVEAQSPQGGVLNLGNGFPNRGRGVPHNPVGGGTNRRGVPTNRRACAH